MGCNCNKGSFSVIEAVKSASSAVVSSVKTFALKDYNPLANDEAKAARLQICKLCDYHHTVLKKSRCKICGCFLEAKASLKDQSCPHPEGAKWQSIQ